jgi:hypothetical protein
MLAGVQDVPMLTEHLARILLDDAFRARLGTAGPGFIKERFGLDKMVDTTLEMFRQTLLPSRQS